RRAPGTPVEYSFRSPEGQSLVAKVPARRFSTTDYLLLFGAYLLNGVAFLGTGLLVAYLKPRNAASLGLLAAGLTTGLFVTTAADLYGPYWFVRLHLLAESFLAPAFFHLALVFPTERLPRYRRRVLLGLYGAFALLAAVYEVVLGSPSAYTAVHLLATDPWARRADDHRGGHLQPGDEPLGARAAPGECGRPRHARRLPDPRRADGGLRLLRRQGAAQHRGLHGVPLPREPRLRDPQARPLRDRRPPPPHDHVRGRGRGHRQPLL